MAWVVAMRGKPVAGAFEAGYAVETHGTRVFLRSLNRVLDLYGKREATVRSAGYRPSRFSTLTSATQGGLDRIDRLPMDLRRRFARELADAYGFRVTEPSPREADEAILRVADQLVQLATARAR